MSGAELTEPRPSPSAWPMYRAMVGIGVACGLLIVTVFQGTLPIIQRNKAEALQKAIFRVLPAAETSATFAFDPTNGFVPAEAQAPPGELAYAGYDGAGALVGVAIEARGMGYQDVIGVIYGYSFEEHAIVGMEVLESKETPGLGDKIETDPSFLESFKRLDVSLTDDGKQLAHPIVAVERGKKTHPWEIDGITGATISSVAIAAILDQSAGVWVPRIESHLAELERNETDQ